MTDVLNLAGGMQPTNRIASDTYNPSVGGTDDHPVDFPIGTPVAQSSDGAARVIPGRADDALTASAVGLTAGRAVVGSSVIVQMNGPIHLTTAQWDEITGDTGGLSFGAVYFLDTLVEGRMTTTAPSSSGEFVTQLGIALSSTDFLIQIGPATAAGPLPIRTPEEIAANVTPVNYQYPAGYVDRYGNNTIPGVTDMTGAANAAISVVSLAVGGGVVSWLAARYLVGSAGVFINYTQSAILHRGASRESTLIINGSTNQPAITCGDGVTAIFGGGVVQMSFSQKSGITAVNGNCAILYSHIGQFLVRDVFVSNNTAAPYRGVVFTGGATGCSQFVTDNLQVQGCLSDGISLILAVDPYIVNCRSDANGGSGWTFNGTQGTLATNCSAFGNGTVAWNLSSSSPATDPNKNNAFVNCVGDTSSSYNWQIVDSQDSRWVGCWAGTQKSILVNTFASGWLLATQYTTRCSFTDCIAINNNAHGFQVFDNGTASTNITFDNCHYVNNGRSAGGGYGWTCNGSSNLLRVHGGAFSGNASGPFLNQSGLPDITVTGSPVGFVSLNQGTGTIAVGTSSVVVTHGLGFTPNLANIQITDTSSRAVSGINSVWTSSPTSTQFTVNSNANVATASFLFVWRAAMNGN